MRTLYFLRHATAEVIRPAQLDIDRCLIEKGRVQARKVGQFMAKHHLLPKMVLSSPYPRAIQTAAIVCNTAKLPDALEVEWLALETPVSESLSVLKAMPADWPSQVLLVGHEPDLSSLISTLLGSDRALLKIRKASLTCLLQEQDAFHLQWSLPVRMMD